MRNDINTCDASFFLVQGCVKIDFLVVMQGTDVWHRIMSFKTRTIDRASHSNVLLERQGPEPDATHFAEGDRFGSGFNTTTKPTRVESVGGF